MANDRQQVISHLCLILTTYVFVMEVFRTVKVKPVSATSVSRRPRDRWVRLIAWDFIVIICLKRTVFAVGEYDRQTDGDTRTA